MHSNAKKSTQPHQPTFSPSSGLGDARTKVAVHGAADDLRRALARRLAEATSLTEVKKLNFSATALKRYAELTGNGQFATWMIELKAETQRRIGEMTLDAARAKRSEANAPVDVEHGTAVHGFHVRFVGPFSAVETELDFCTTMGPTDWCSAFRDMHDGHLAEPASAELLKEFANAAPTILLRAYVHGALFARDTSPTLGIPLAEWIAGANREDDPELRRFALGSAFRVLSAEIIRLQP